MQYYNPKPFLFCRSGSHRNTEDSRLALNIQNRR